MRNVSEVVEAAARQGDPYFPARHDHWLVQTGDGWAAHVAGAIGVSTDAQASWWGGRASGTVPHGLIAAYGGDTVAAAEAVLRRFGDEMNITVLVDFVNHSVHTALEVADALGTDLWGVRLDTSEAIVDARGGRRWATRASRRATPAGREGARRARRGGPSGTSGSWCLAGSTRIAIRAFEASGVPVDAYGVGSSLIRGSRTTSPPTWSSRRASRRQSGSDTYAFNERLARVE